MTSMESEAGAPAASGVQTAGAWLREARQQSGLHIAALAAMLKVPQAKLEALEADRYQELPDATFTRALAKAICRALKVDPDPVMGLLPRGGERDLDVSRGLNQPYRERGGREEGVSLAWLQRPVVWGPALLLLAAALVYTMPSNWLMPAASHESAAALPANAPAPVVANAVDAADVAASQPSTAASEAVPQLSLPMAAQATAMVPAPVQASAPAAALADGQVPLFVKVKSDSWVQIVDAQGQTLLSRLMRAGEQQELAGKTPLKVTIGNVAGTELSLRGAAVDLGSQSKDNVARLELN
jgi:cytoskeleton protein RodZ